MMARRLTAVLAHPDDESFPIGGTLARYAGEGVDVHLIVATRDEAGIPGKSAAETAVIREAELRRACAELGVNQLIFLGSFGTAAKACAERSRSNGTLCEQDRFVDGTLADLPDDTGIKRLLEALHRSQPDVIITFGPDGISGHPDHVAVSRWTTAAFDRLPQKPDGPQRLYYIAPSQATQQGCGVPPPAEVVGGPVVFIDVRAHLVKKVRPAQQHQSQNPPFNGDPAAEAQNLACHELFRLARPKVAANGHGPGTDLFTGLI